MEEKTLLNEEELENVSGGGSGNIPDGGITYSTYTSAYGGHYYAKTSGSTELLYTEIDASGWANYYLETLIVDIETNTWSTNRTGKLPGAPEHLYSEYPFVLNIRP